jgi:ammonia channel protein AmtB
VSTIEAFFIGFLGATLTFMTMMLLERIYWFDDPVAAFPVHGLSGVWVSMGELS